MNPTQWRQVKAQFAELCEQHPESWNQTLTAISDSEVAAELRRLLLAHQNASGLPDLPTAVEPTTDLVLGRKLGPFLVERLIGEGGSGRVYLAEREGVGGKVAVKLLRGRLLGPQITRRFHAEQVILAQLEHPNIARLLQVGVADDGTPWLAMEYVVGEAFSQAIARLDLRQRLQVVEQLLSAVDYAHRQLVVHRDIKPGNILIAADGQPKLLDFGIAKRLDDAGAQLTQTQGQVRTPAYAAPEQIRGDTISVATDVYALGVLLYEVLAECRPWTETGSQLDAAILAGAAPLPSSRAPANLRRQLRGDLDAIVMQAMHRDPRRRYPSAAALAADLQRYADRRPVLAQKQTLSYRTGRFFYRNYRWVGVGGLVVAALALVGVREHQLREEALLSAQKSDQVASFMLDMFNAGDSQTFDYAVSKDATVMELIGKADASLAALDSAPLVQADLAHKIGQVYWGLSEYDQAHRLFSQAIALREASLGDHSDTAESYLMLGRVYGRSGRYEQMLESVQHSYQMRLKILGPSHPDTLHSVHRIGAAHYFLNRFERAKEYLTRAIEGSREQQPESRLLLANALIVLAQVKADEGQFEESAELFDEVLALRKLTHAAVHPAQSEARHNLSTVLFDIGRIDEAIELHWEAIKIDEQVNQADHLDLVIDYEWMARYQIAAGELELAEEMADKAVAMATRLQQQSANPGLLDRARQIQVEVWREHGRIESALTLQRDVLRSRESLLQTGHRFVLESRSVLADLLRRDGEPVLARAELLRSIEGWREQPTGFVRQLLHSLDTFAEADECEWLAGDWPQPMAPAMLEALKRTRIACDWEIE